jgi:hypothetical protein
MAFTSANTDVLRRSELWSAQLKEILRDELMVQGYVRWLTEFPDGDTFTIPSIGQAIVRDYAENEPVKYDPMDTGEFQFTIGEYVQAGTYITKKAKQDMYYMNQLVSSFVPEQRRAIMEKLESDILALQSGQTAGNVNAINGANHRMVGSGTNDTIGVKDFALAKYALQKANVPMTNLVGIVDPSVEYAVSILANLVALDQNPKWEGIVAEGFSTGMRFTKSIYGFDCYTSNYLKGGLSETVNANSVTNGVANLFFSAAGNVSPFVGAWRQQPEVDGEYNKDLQRDEFVTTARYGLKLYRPENLVVVITDSTQVA